jgi:hypothetical protein
MTIKKARTILLACAIVALFTRTVSASMDDPIPTSLVEFVCESQQRLPWCNQKNGYPRGTPADNCTGDGQTCGQCVIIEQFVKVCVQTGIKTDACCKYDAPGVGPDLGCGNKYEGRCKLVSPDYFCNNLVDTGNACDKIKDLCKAPPCN